MATSRILVLSSIAAILSVIHGADDEVCTKVDGTSCDEKIDLGRYPRWDDAPTSAEEFDHDNDKTVCRLPVISVEEWEAGRYWEGEEPVIVQNVIEGWPALEHWTK